MDEKPDMRMVGLLILLMMAPIALLFIVMGAWSIEKGEWPYGFAMIGMVPIMALSAWLGRRWPKRDLEGLEGAGKRCAFLRNYLLESVPMALCFGFIGMEKTMKPAEAAMAYGKTVLMLLAIMIAVALIAHEAIERCTAWRARRKG